MVGAPGSTAPAPLKGPVVDVFLVLMVGTPGSLAPVSPRGAVVDVS
jgi:hypothetical protein